MKKYNNIDTSKNRKEVLNLSLAPFGARIV